MANFGNAWHIPNHPEPRGRGAMRDPNGALVPGMAITIISGNQFQGGAGQGNQLQDGSSVFFRNGNAGPWTELPMKFFREVENNKYFTATISAETSKAFQTGDEIQYYLQLAYSDRDLTFLHADAGGNDSVRADNEVAAQNAPFRFSIESSAEKGLWSPVFLLPNVAIHTHVLRNGRVLMWGRRDASDPDNLDVHRCTPFVWDPLDPLDPMDSTTAKTVNTLPPKRADGTTVNLFCSGHAFLPDGRLLVVGGHNFDGDGLDQAIIYSPAPAESNAPGTWAPTAPMGGETLRRWYPTATTLPNGNVLVLSGSYIDPNRPQGQQTVVVALLQIWENGTWKTIKKPNGDDLNFFGLSLYPRMHVATDGRVFMSGALAQTSLLQTSQPGGWTEVGLRANGQRDYCPSVMYDADKVIYIGGGNNAGSRAPTAAAEVIDLAQNPRQWQATNPMQFPRRQHNAVILPDGTVLVTGGTRGGGGFNDGFNDLAAGQPVHTAELWNPATQRWTELAAEEVDRGYHSTAVLLPDGRVLSAGGGEYRPDNVNTNDPLDSHREAQVFSPPYLFQGPRPLITSAPASVDYGESFAVDTAQADEISQVSWIRLASVTHAFDQSQRINFLDFKVNADKLTVTAPDSPNLCPPGYYLLFILKDGVPSVAKIIRIQLDVAPALLAAPVAMNELLRLSPVVAQTGAHSRISSRETEVAATAKGTAVVVGITGTCPYGIGSCWGGAYEALRNLQGVEMVNPVPDTNDSTAKVFLQDERLPQLNAWDSQFRSMVNGTYVLRGVEVTLRGRIEAREETLYLVNTERPDVQLRPLRAEDRIQWDHTARSLKPLEEEEAGAYDRLRQSGDEQVTVTGPLMQTEASYQLSVRLFEA